MSDGEDDLPRDEDDAASSGIPNAADGAGIDRARKRTKRDKDRARDFWRGVLADEVGREEIWKLLDRAGALRAPFQLGPTGFPNEQSTWFAAGQQAYMLQLFFTLMGHDFRGVQTMLVEGHAIADSEK